MPLLPLAGLPRLFVTALGAAFSMIASAPAEAAPVITRASIDSVESAHREIWRRFISADGTVLDYTDHDGKVILPTPEQCRENKPNGLGWWTPIENGSFFGGVYMDGLCSRWQVTRDAATADKARKLAAGLVKLASAGDTPGFIARGFASDGKTHFPASSDDQSYPWFFGMWRYLSSGIPDEVERERMVRLVEKVALAFEGYQWRIPSDCEGFGFFGAWEGEHFDANVRLLFIHRALYDLTKQERWLERYQAKLSERRGPKKLTRLEICAAGSDYISPGVTPQYPLHPPVWTSASSQAGLRALWELENDPAVREQFRAGLQASAWRAVDYLKQWRKYNAETADGLAFNVDWRDLNDVSAGWVPQATIAEAIKLGIHQYGPWKKLSPRRIYENDYMRDPLFAAWVIFLSGEPALIDESSREFLDALSAYRWSRMYTSCFFMVENAYWRLRLQTGGR